MAERFLNIAFDLGYDAGYNTAHRDMISMMYEAEEGWILKSK